jgi:hypothetical protein
MSTGIFVRSQRLDGLLIALFGCLILFGARVEYEDLVAFESGARESIRLNLLMRLLYSLFGKWGIITTLIAAGCAALGYGVKKLITGR